MVALVELSRWRRCCRWSRGCGWCCRSPTCGPPPALSDGAKSERGCWSRSWPTSSGHAPSAPAPSSASSTISSSTPTSTQDINTRNCLVMKQHLGMSMKPRRPRVVVLCVTRWSKPFLYASVIHFSAFNHKRINTCMHRCVDKNFQGSFRKPRRIVKAVLDFFWIANSLIRKSICGKVICQDKYHYSILKIQCIIFCASLIIVVKFELWTCERDSKVLNRG